MFLFKQKTAYEWRISDWSSDVCSSDLLPCQRADGLAGTATGPVPARNPHCGHGRTAAGRRREPSRYRSDGPGGRPQRSDRQSVVSGKSVSIRVDLGGRRILNTTTAVTHDTIPSVIYISYIITLK